MNATTLTCLLLVIILLATSGGYMAISMGIDGRVTRAAVELALLELAVWPVFLIDLLLAISMADRKKGSPEEPKGKPEPRLKF
jgi:hypothetical protein